MDLEKNAHTENPAFIAVEWASNQFLHIALIQRRQFRHDVAVRWPNASQPILDEIELSLGFEGDSRVGIFDQVPVVWLDEGDRRDPAPYAVNRLKGFDAFMRAHPVAPDHSDLLNRLGQGANDLDGAKRNDRRPDRDVKFASRLLGVIGNAADDYDAKSYSADGHERVRWGIVVAGTNHCLFEPGNFYWLVDQAGHHCYVRPI